MKIIEMKVPKMLFYVSVFGYFKLELAKSVQVSK